MAIILCTKEMGENGKKTCQVLGKCPEQTKYGCPKEVLSEVQKLKNAEAEVVRLRTLLDMKKEGLPAPEVKPVIPEVAPAPKPIPSKPKGKVK